MNKPAVLGAPKPERHGWTTYEDGPPTRAPDLNLIDLLRILSRRRWLLIGTVALITGLGIINVLMMTPLYTSTTSVMVDPQNKGAVDVESLLLSGGAADPATMESEVQVVVSRGLAERVLAETGIDRLAEFNQAVWEEQNPDRFRLPRLGDLPGWLKSLLMDREEVPDEGDAAARLHASILNKFLERLSVTAVGRSRVLTVEFTSEDPALAARVADSVASLYITQQIEQKFDARRKATAWLTSQLSVLQQQVEDAERQVQVARSEQGVVQGRDAALLNEQISQINTQLVLTRAENNTNQAQFQSLKTAMETRGRRVALDGLDPGATGALKAQETTLRSQLADALKRLGDRHPDVISLRSSLAAVSGAINEEADRRLPALRDIAQVSQQRVSELEKSLQALEQEAARVSEAEVRIAALQREADATRTLFETMLARSKEFEAVNIEKTNAWIVSRASIPLSPSYPRKTIFIAVALVLGLGLGLTLVFLAEQLEGGIQTQEDVERLLHLPSLGMIPMVRRSLMSRKPPQDYAVDKMQSAFSISINRLVTSLIMGQQRRGGDKSDAGIAVLLTSSVPGEGKSAVASSLTRLVEASKYDSSRRKVIVIDCDMRRPNIHTTLSMPNRGGLSDFLRGKADLDSIIKADPRTGAHVITAGSRTDSPESLIRSPLFDKMLVSLRPHYNLILLDAPPVLAVPDTVILAGKAACCILIVKWRQTPRRLVQLAARQLQEAGGMIAGVALNQVDVRKAGQYGSGEALHYMGSRSGYVRN